ncbi:MAG TPA: ABC transporter permease [Vicinamibacterales bacterium]|nr:ABC transporter permease [Vicinamibacterales bacterium]
MSLWQDLRFATRMLVKDRWFTLAAASALALGIGANATVFTLVNAVLLRGIPFEEPDRIVVLETANKGQQAGVSFEDFKDWRDRSRSFSQLTARLGATVNLSDNDHVPERYRGTYLSWNFFQMIGERPILGRDFQSSDDIPGAQPVVMLGYGAWKSRYGGDPGVLGKTVRVNSRPAVIVGVMPQGMKFPNNDDLWIPVTVLPPESFTGRGGRSFGVMGRLAPGVSVEQARSELTQIGADLEREYPATNKEWRPAIQTYNESQQGGPIFIVFLALQGAVAFVLLIACANVANLLLARSVNRVREIAIRTSIGAGRWRIVRQLLVESVLLASVSGVVGLVLAVAGVRWFDAATQDVGKPYYMTFTFDPVVFLFFAAICLASGILFGLAPALHVSKTNVNDVLKENGRGGTGSVAARRWAGALVVVEVVLTVVLLSGAGFMMRSFMSLYAMETNFNSANLLSMDLYLPLTKYPQYEPRGQIYQNFADRLDAIPGIQAALANNAPMNGATVGGPIGIDGVLPPQGEQKTALQVPVSDRYFEVLGMPVRRGRTFTRGDGLPGRGVALVNERFAEVFSKGVDPLGRQIRFTTQQASPNMPAGEWMSIVGVVPNVRQGNPRSPDPDAVVYVPLRSNPQRTPTLFVRTTATAATVLPQIREALKAVEPDLPLFNVQTMDERLAQNRWEFVVFGSMFGAFAGIALLLSAVGLFAVTTYSVTQRTQEIGVRMALGAQPRSILWLVLRRALIQLAIGLPLGIAGAVGVGIVLESILVQTGPRDVATLTSIVMLLIVVAVVACLWPARRAASLDPVIALRGDA